MPAVAGLAAAFQHIVFPGVRNPYCNGLWRDFLCHDLLWRVDEPLSGRSEQRSMEPAYPSWSWVSVHGRVAYWPEESWVHNLTITEVSYFKKGLAETPEYNDVKLCEYSRLEVWGRLTPAKLQYTRTTNGDISESIYNLVYYRMDPYSDLRGPSITDWSSGECMVPSVGRVLSFHADYCLSKGLGARQIADGQSLYCLGRFFGEKVTLSLVLREKTDDEGQPVYERVGIVEVPDEIRKEKLKVPAKLRRRDPYMMECEESTVIIV